MPRLVVAAVLASLLAACGKGDKPPPPSSGGLLTQETGPSHKPPHGPNGPSEPSQAEKIFFNQCAMCHGMDGTGNGPAAQGLPVKPRNYTDGTWQASVTDDEIKKTILLGGRGVGKNPAMPDFRQLKDQPEVLDGLVKIIRSFKK